MGGRGRGAYYKEKYGDGGENCRGGGLFGVSYREDRDELPQTWKKREGEGGQRLGPFSPFQV